MNHNMIVTEKEKALIVKLRENNINAEAIMIYINEIIIKN